MRVFTACKDLLDELVRRGLPPRVEVSAEFEEMLFTRAPDLYPLYEQCVNEVLLAREDEGW